MKIKLLFFILFPLLLVAQSKPLKVLRGIVFSDTLKVERVTIINITRETFSVTDDIGQFSIFASENDEIIFSSVAFETKKIILKNSNFDEMIFRVELDVKMNQLEEIKIGPYKLTGDLTYDAKRIIVKPSLKVDFPKLDLSNLEITGVKTVENSAMPNVNKSLGGVDFVRLTKGLVSLIKKPSSSKVTDRVSFEEFKSTLKKEFGNEYFKEKLKIENDALELFFNYCYTDEVASKKLLELANRFALIEYLEKKSITFNNL
jgi:hypothetical protein